MYYPKWDHRAISCKYIIGFKSEQDTFNMYYGVDPNATLPLSYAARMNDVLVVRFETDGIRLRDRSYGNYF